MSDPTPIREFVASQRAPLRVWVGPMAQASAEPVLREHLGGQGEVQAVPAAGEKLTGPAILVVAAEDLNGPHRDVLLELARRALPGRPIVVGGSGSKQTLLDAINTWSAFRMLQNELPGEALVDAVRGAYRALTLELSVELCARVLHRDCWRLRSAVEELQATQEQLLHAERLTTVGRIVGKLMTQAQDQLAAVARCRDTLEKLGPERPLAMQVECAIEGINSFDTLLRDMLALAENRSEHTELRLEQLDPLVESSTRLFLHDPLGRSREIRTLCHSAATVDVDRYRMCHVLLNLLRNAAQATKEGDRIEVRTRREQDAALIEVEDAGAGMTRETRERIFTPFFTTKGKAGMGLGLRLARATVECQGGTLDCTSIPGKGTCFRIRLPLAG
jgi:signal transduction histidine kinase